ncbi:DUF3618 domain-containing protein [uncultured Arthrobacter sp.]|uniref:DUF3618 domain-containing protein n=1 Tax=uncultured Arthrobacter sp. TaxID=114050 RepID=UPI002622CA52|nr:DUF3618 domain-containing protein [uncultured Arthrobacter sp.]
MSQSPDTIRADIARTRAELGLPVDATAETLPAETNTAASAARHAGEAIHDAPATAKTKAQGNPLAAGLIAFGAGLLAASLIPASAKETEAASALKEKAQPLMTEATDAAKQVVEDLKEPAGEAVDSVKQTATDSAQTVKDEGTHAASDLQDKARGAKDNVQGSSS